MKHRRVGTFLLAAATATAWLIGCARDSPPGDVLLITVDALRPDHMSLYGYDRPTSSNLDRWMADGAIYQRAYAAAGQTAPSVISLLSGRLPQEHRVRLIWQLVPDDVPLLPDLLPPEYQSAAFVANMVLTDEAMGLGKRFDVYDDFVDERESSRSIYERSAARTTDAAISWLAGERESDRPLFLWVHYIDPHGPYDPPADRPITFEHTGRQAIEPERIKEYIRAPHVTDALDYVDRYDEEIAYVDQHLDRLLDAYTETRDLERSLLVFSSDHGESLMERDGWFRHGFQVYEEVVRVPLALRGQGVLPGIRAEPASILDVVPTVLAFVGAPLPRGLRGIDLRAPSAAETQRSIFVETSRQPFQWRAEIRGDRKWVVRLGRGVGDVQERRLYDLKADPRELAPLSWSPDADGPTELLALCRADPDPGGLPSEYASGRRLTDPKVDERADTTARDRLRSLGYVD